MGVDFTAVFDHNLSWDELYALPQTLRLAWKLPVALEAWTAEHVRADRLGWTWVLTSPNSSAAEQLFNDEFLELDGPLGFGVCVHKRGVQMDHLARWFSFASESRVQEGLIEAATSFARLLRAKMILYLPDNALPPAEGSDLLFDGLSVQEIAEWLRVHVGPPAAHARDLRDVAAEDVFENGYVMQLM